MDEPVLNRVHNQFGGVVNAKRSHYVGAVNTYRVRAETEPGSDFLVGLATYDQLQDLKLARTQCAGSPAFWGGLYRCQLRIKHKFTGRDSLDCRGQIQVPRVLENVTANTGFNGLAYADVF